ncbi:unnamed protein product, partial [Phaeothamnion confervicola]
VKGTVTPSDVWSVALNGITYNYTVGAHDNINGVATGLRAAINASGIFTAAGTGADIQVTIKAEAWFTGFTQNL